MQPLAKLKQLLDPRSSLVLSTESRGEFEVHKTVRYNTNESMLNYSIGKRSMSNKTFAHDHDYPKENSHIHMLKSKHERIIDLETKYKAISEKLSASKSDFQSSPSGKVFLQAELLTAKVSTHSERKVIPEPLQLNESSFMTPKKSQILVEPVRSGSNRKIEEPLKETKSTSNVVTIDLEIDKDPIKQVQVVQPTTAKKFTPDKETRLAYRSYAARTNHGLLREYNEDRVSIIQKIYIDSTQDFPASFFALFDGHSGVQCADYLRDNLHQFVTRQPSYRKEKKKALMDGVTECEKKFLEKAQLSADNSGSCALVCLFENTKLYVANVGDSRAIFGKFRGKISEQITVDHKPEEKGEKERIFKMGGSIFRSKKCVYRESIDLTGTSTELVEEMKYGPYRVNPGGLSVSRTIGDLPAKDSTKGGNPNCIIGVPEVHEIDLTGDHDFIVMACDGIYDVLSNEEVVKGVWESLQKHTKSKGLKEACRIASEYVMKMSFDKRSMDNVTVIIVAFQREEYYY